MPFAKVDLANMALAHLRQRPVASTDGVKFDGATPEAVYANQFYDLALHEAFRAFDWPFARVYRQGVKIGEAKPNWKFGYVYPQDVEIVRYIVKNDRTEADVRYHVMQAFIGPGNGKAIFTNEDNAYFSCTAYIDDPSLYPPDFIEFASLTLAAHLAMPITGKAELMMGMRKLAQDAGQRAAATAAASETADDGEGAGRLAATPPTVQVDIANSALSMLGQDAIVTFGDRTRQGDTVRRFYRQAVDMALRAFDWPFARVATLGAKVNAPAIPNWSFAYAFPECAAFRYIMQQTATEQPIRYQILRVSDPAGARYIYTNVDNAVFVITALVEDPTQWPQDFVQVVSANLAQMMALPLTGKAEVLKAMAEAAETALKLAVMSASQEENEQDGADAGRDAPLVNSVPVEVANLALGLIGQEPIQTFGERTKRANAVRRFYALALRATLRAVDWPFARIYDRAAPSDAPRLPGWRYAYGYPANCAALRGFAKDYPTDNEARFTIANGVIYTNRSAATLIYTRWDVEPSKYDPEFVELLAHELGAMIAVPLTGKNEAATYLRQVAKALRDKAAADAMNEEPFNLDDRVPDWLAVRGIPSLTREDREYWGGGWRAAGRAEGYGDLPGSGPVNPTPPMVSGPGPGSLVLPAYIPGLTAPVEPPAPLLSSSDFWVENVGGRIERDGRLVIDDPSDEYREPDYDIQEDN